MSTTDPTTPEPTAAPAPEPLIEPAAPPAAQPVAAPGPEVVETEVIVAEVVEDEPVVEAVATAAEPASPAAPQPQVVYVQPIAPPRKQGNRGIGTILALVATGVFAAALAGATWVLGWLTAGATGFAFLGEFKFWLPVVVFAVAFVLLVLLANRANWWAYILGSIFVALGVYFGTIGIAVLLDVVLRVPAPTTFGTALVSPFVIVAALLAREVSMWFGSILARRGRKLKVRNAEARAAYEREAAERRASTGY